MESYKSVDDFMIAHQNDAEMLEPLREVMLQSPLEETVKWGIPCYTYKGKNVCGFCSFKSYSGIWFYQGALLSDPAKKLINAQEGVTKAMRQWRFESPKEIDADLILQYINEAIANQEAGLEIKPEKKPLVIPELLQAALDKDSLLNSKFEALNLTKKREFAEHIGSAKREETKLSRLEKCKLMIHNGIGLNDKYR